MMLYDLRLTLHYDYQGTVQDGRHLIRIVPRTIEGTQRLIASSLNFDPIPHGQSRQTDFFGNNVTAIDYHTGHDHLDVSLTARVQVDKAPIGDDASPPLGEMAQQISRLWSLAPLSPHHFLAASPRIQFDPEITAYAAQSVAPLRTVFAIALDFCHAIHADFDYDPKATDVQTNPSEAFALKKGVCQDFAHVMIAGLRGVGIAAGYVSGFLRTIPPAGKPRLEGADAMHAWVRVWCGSVMGWVEFDPTNAMLAGNDHICIGYGRDYADISPIVGILKTSGGQHTKQSVDVLLVE